MTDEAISPLRRRMIEDMTIRKFAPKTQHDYVQRVKNFAVFLGRSPDTASWEDVRRYQLHLASSGVGAPTINQHRLGAAVLLQGDARSHRDRRSTLHVIHEPRKLPVVLSPEEVARLLEAAPGLKYKAALSVAYGAGLRVSEVVSLKVSDIDSKRMMHPGRAGQGPQGPLTRCSRHTCSICCAPGGRRHGHRAGCSLAAIRLQPMTTRQLNRACHAAAQMAEINKRVSLHTCGTASPLISWSRTSTSA